MLRLTQEVAKQANGILRAGRTSGQVASMFSCHHSAIVRLCKRFQELGTVDDRPRPGQSRMTIREQAR